MMTSISHLARVKQGTAALVLGAILAAAGCRGDTVSPPPPAPPIIARVEVTASRTTLGTGDTLRATAAALDSTGKAVSGATFSWSTDDVSLATVDTGGFVHALRAGSVHVQATATGPAESLKSVVTGQVAFTLRQILTSVKLTAPDTVVTGDTVQLTATAYDGVNAEMPHATITWASSDTLGAAVTPSGRLIGRGIGGTTVVAHATADGASAEASKPIKVRLVLESIASGTYHNCGIARGGIVHCWGEGAFGRLGTGINYAPWKSVTAPVAALVDARFTSVVGDEQQDSRSGHTCARSTTGLAYCWGSGAWGMLADGNHGEGIPPYANAFPTPLSGVSAVKQVGGGAMHTCVVDGTGAAYCAGSNQYLQLGVDVVLDSSCDGPCSRTLVAVQGGHVFASLVVGGYHSCGLTAAGEAWCWGSNGNGQLGATTTGYTSGAPVHASTIAFAALAAGAIHTCGLDNTGDVYCWGDGWWGEVGSGQGGYAGRRDTPARVVTLQKFASVYAGEAHTCALTADGTAYCWGENNRGQLGFTSTEICGEQLPNSIMESCSTTPQPVNTTLRFVALGIGHDHTCGLVAAGQVYCWGGNDRGQLGDGTTTDRLSPTQVVDTK